MIDTSFERDRSESDGIFGFTIAELMVVIAIIGILAAIAGRSMTRRDNAVVVETFAHRIWVTLRQAHNLAVGTGAVVQVTISNDGAEVTLERASLLGAGPPTGSEWIEISKESALGTAVIQAVTGTADITENLDPGSLPGDGATLTFSPDGSASAASIYVRDAGEVYRYKVVLFSVTGFAMEISRW